MTKEQEGAIKYLEKQINYFKEQIKFIEAVDCDYYDEEYKLYKNRVKQFETVLNMLKEKDNIIEGKECVIETQAYNEEVLLNTLKKKDKIIDYLLRACLHSIVSGEKFTLEINNKKYEDKDIDVRIEQLRKFVAEKAEQSSGINTTPEKN